MPRGAGCPEVIYKTYFRLKIDQVLVSGSISGCVTSFHSLSSKYKKITILLKLDLLKK